MRFTQESMCASCLRKIIIQKTCSSQNFTKPLMTCFIFEKHVECAPPLSFFKTSTHKKHKRDKYVLDWNLVQKSLYAVRIAFHSLSTLPSARNLDKTSQKYLSSFLLLLQLPWKFFELKSVSTYGSLFPHSTPTGTFFAFSDYTILSTNFLRWSSRWVIQSSFMQNVNDSTTTGHLNGTKCACTASKNYA